MQEDSRTGLLAPSPLCIGCFLVLVTFILGRSPICLLCLFMADSDQAVRVVSTNLEKKVSSRCPYWSDPQNTALGGREVSCCYSWPAVRWRWQVDKTVMLSLQQQPEGWGTLAELAKESSKVGGRAWGAADFSDVAATAGIEMPQGTAPSSHPQPHTRGPRPKTRVPVSWLSLNPS